MILLEVRKISKMFGGVAALRDVNFNLDEGQLLALIGPQWRRQVHLLQHSQRPTEAGQRQHQAGGRGAGWPELTTNLEPRRRTDFSGRGRIRFNDGSRERPDGTVVERQRPPADPACCREVLQDGSTSLARKGRDAGTGRPAIEHSRLWRRQEARTCDGVGERSQVASDGRADGRHGAERTSRVDAAHLEPCAGAEHVRAFHRAQHGTWCSPMPTSLSFCRAGLSSRRAVRKAFGMIRLFSRPISAAERRLRPKPEKAADRCFQKVRC